MITVKLKYKTDNNSLSTIKAYMEHYSKCVRFMYNRICDNPSISEKDLRELSHNINNIDLLNAYQIQCCIKEAKQLYSANGSGMVFGGRKNFIRRCKCRIAKDEWNQKKLSSFCVLGEAPQKGNRNFRIDTANSRIIFQPNKNLHINLSYSDKLHGEYAKIINSAEILQNNKLTPITYKLDMDYVYITLDETNAFGTKQNNFVENRVFAIDMNPNYIGWSVIDWKDEDQYNIIDHGTISIKKINDFDSSLWKLHTDSSDALKLYISNKRDHEICEVSKRLVNMAFHYSCQLFSIEDLDGKSKDCGLGKKYNKLVNSNWCRDKLVNNLTKRCNIFSIKLIKVKPQYSSFIGNIVFREENLPDMELASIEISRRGFEFYTQYVSRTRPTRKNIVQPNLNNRYGTMVSKSLEEFGYRDGYSDLVDLYYKLKKLDVKYRLSLDQAGCGFFRLFSSKSLMFLII